MMVSRLVSDSSILEAISSVLGSLERCKQPAAIVWEA